MNKHLLSSALMLIISSTSYAEITDTATTNTTPSQPAVASETQIPEINPAATVKINVNDLNCNYHIPSETNEISQDIIIHWAKQAAIQSFSFSPESIQAQLESLKPCFTDKGWTGFNDALEKSGNINSIKNQNLTVSSQVEGLPSMAESKDDRWRVSVPLEVVYQNEKDKITQQLDVNVLVGRKPSGDLGIMQVIATPKQTAKTTEDANTQAAKTTDLENKDNAPVTESPSSSPVENSKPADTQ